MKTKFMILLVVLALVRPAVAWDHLGHMTVAQIAYNQLDAKTKQAVDAAINKFNEKHGTEYTFVTAACWMDDIRNTSEDHYDPWHFINPAFTTDGNPWPTAEQHNVLWAIGLCSDVIAGKKTYNGIDANQALVMLLHLTGDIHQPLHCTAYENDHGGNGVPVSNMTDKTKKQRQLHHFWDTAYRRGFENGKVIETFTHPPFNDQTADVAHYDALDLVTIKADEFVRDFQPDEASLASVPTAWAIATHHQGFSHGYHDVPGGVPSPNVPITLNSTYVEMARTLACKQIVAAGTNLAHYLNELYAQPPTQPIARLDTPRHRNQ